MPNLDTGLWILNAVIPLGLGLLAALLPPKKRSYRYALVAAGVIGTIVAMMTGLRNQNAQAASQAQVDRILHNTENLPSQSGFLQYDRSEIQLGEGTKNFVAGRPVFGKAYFANRGQRPVQNALIWVKVWFINLSLMPGGDQQVDEAFNDAVEKAMSTHPNQGGSTVGLNKDIWMDDGAIPTQEAIDGLATGAWRLYFVASTLWRDEDGKPHRAHSCTWVSNVNQQADLSKTPLIWHNCEISR